MKYSLTKNKFITVNGKKIAYREIGVGNFEKPLVMLVHLAATMDNWDPKTIDLIAKKNHVIAIDLPGVGSSEGKVATTIPGMAEQTNKIIKKLGFKKINLLGLSMGGMIAQEVVHLNSNLVDKLILVGTAPRGGSGLTNVATTTFGYIFRAMFTCNDPKRFIFYNHDKAGKADADEILGRMNARTKEFRSKNMKVRGFLRQLCAIRRYGKAQAEDMKFISQQTLIVNGDKDLMVPIENSYVMNEKIANSELIIYPNAGHGSLFQLPEKFSKDLQKFLEK